MQYRGLHPDPSAGSRELGAQVRTLGRVVLAAILMSGSGDKGRGAVARSAA